MRTPLKVMQLALSLVIGGTEKLVYDIVQQVDPQKVSSVVCCLDTLGHFGEELQKEGYPVVALHRKPGIDWKLIQRLSALLRQEKIDVIHAHQYTPYFYGFMAAWHNKIRTFSTTPKLVFTEHGRFYPDERKLKRVITNPVLSLFTDEIVTISEQTKSSLITYENFPAHRIRVVYNGIELSKFSQPLDGAAKKKELGLPPDAPVIGIVARLDPIKNHAMLLRAFKQVLETLPDACLLIVGDGPEGVNLKTLAESLGIMNNTTFLGARRDVPELLQTFDVFALSSFSEGTSVTLLEAMGASIPIVATRVGGNPEVVQDRETGYLVQSDDEQDMAAMLLALLQDKETRQRMGHAGRQRVQQMFSLEKMVNAYTGLYLKVSGISQNS